MGRASYRFLFPAITESIMLPFSHTLPRPRAVSLVAGALLLMQGTRAFAQGKAADYRRADSLPAKVTGKIIDLVDTPTWIPNSTRLWYKKSVNGGDRFMLVDAVTKEKRLAFDHEKMAAALSAAGKTRYTALDLPIRSIAFADGDRAIDVTADSARYRCTLADAKCVPQPSGGGRFGGGGGRGGGGAGAMIGGGLFTDRARSVLEGSRTSPDGHSEAFIRDFNVWTRTPGGKTRRH